MKRTVQLLLLLSLVAVLLAGCGGNPAPVENVVDQAPTPLAVAPEDATEEVVEVEATLPPPVVDSEPTPTLAPGAPGGDDEEPAAAPEQPESEAATGPMFPWPADRFGYGVQIHGNATVGDPVATMDAVANQLGMDWIKVQIEWPTVHPSPDAGQWFIYDGVLDQAYNYGINVMLSVVGAPDWTRASGTEDGPPDDYGQYAAFLEELLTRYEGKVQAIEVWNEQNLDREWRTANGVNPEDYVRFLEVAYEAIKAHDPNIIVISGALSPTGSGDWVRWADDFEWLDRALAAGMLDYADCVGAHHNGYNVGPDVPFDQTGSAPDAATAVFRGPFDNPHHSWSFKTTLDTYAAKVQAVDPDMKLCVTEFGWPSSEGYDQPPEGFGFAADNTLEEQATYIVDAFQLMRESGDVWLTFLFNFDYGNKSGGPTNDNVPYSIVDVNGVPRPAYGAIAAMEKTP
jgi:polysaccharide biosynthesis protein PslG